MEIAGKKKPAKIEIKISQKVGSEPKSYPPRVLPFKGNGIVAELPWPVGCERFPPYWLTPCNFGGEQGKKKKKEGKNALKQGTTSNPCVGVYHVGRGLRLLAYFLPFFWSLIEGSPSHSFERSKGEGKKHDEEKGFACNWLEQPFRPPSHFFFPFVQCAEPWYIWGPLFECPQLRLTEEGERGPRLDPQSQGPFQKRCRNRWWTGISISCKKN